MIVKAIKWLLILLTLVFSLVLTAWLTTPFWLEKLINYYIATYGLHFQSQKITTRWPIQIHITDIKLSNADSQSLIKAEHFTLSLSFLAKSQSPIELGLSINNSAVWLERLKNLNIAKDNSTTPVSLAIKKVLKVPISWHINNAKIHSPQNPTTSFFSSLEQSSIGPHLRLSLQHNQQSILTVNSKWQVAINQLTGKASLAPSPFIKLLGLNKSLPFIIPDNSQLTADIKLNLPDLSNLTVDDLDFSFLRTAHFKRINGYGSIQYQAVSPQGKIAINTNWKQQQGNFTAQLIPIILWNHSAIQSSSKRQKKSNDKTDVNSQTAMLPKQITFSCHTPLELTYHYHQQQTNLTGECQTKLLHSQYQLHLINQIESINHLSQWYIYTKLDGQLAPTTEAVNQLNSQLNVNVQLTANGIHFKLMDNATISLTQPQLKPYAANAVQLLVRQLSADITDLNKPVNSLKLSSLFDIAVNQPTFSNQVISPRVISQHQLKIDKQLTNYQGDWQIGLYANLSNKLQWQLADKLATINWDLKVKNLSQLTNQLAPIIPNWPKQLSFQSGQLTSTFTGKILFKPLLLSGKALTKINQINLLYEKTKLQNINGELQLSVKNNHVVSTKSRENKIKAELVDVGIPIETVSTQLQFNSHLNQPAKTKLHLNQLQAKLLGGSITAPTLNLIPFSNQQITLSVSAVDLAKLVALEQQPTITASGKVNGVLPIEIIKNKPSISNGTLQTSGTGWIKVKQPTMANNLSTSNENLKLVFSALTNFQYDQLASNVNLAPNGDLVLTVRLAGKNPDFYQGKRIHFNYKQEENIYLLIKSLQLGQDIGENVTKKLQRPSRD
ncbi:YdbH domain-containing protein [Spartinivicinus ruber]|uniref:YdbH domain-containing protein n=1 Tax=Spartinivicinus ruber TaxID=2683272 RepID=UPI0013D3505A|nr:YdbH domain-containing protein [Spartinivicinus ruber]